MDSRQIEIQRRIYLKKYMSEVAALSKLSHSIEEEDISSMEFLDHIKNANRDQLLRLPKRTISIDFEERKSERFCNFIEELFSLNGTGVYLLTDNARACGVYKFPSILSVNFDFPDDAIRGDVFVLLAERFDDKLLLDIEKDSSGTTNLQIELTGSAWPMAKTYN